MFSLQWVLKAVAALGAERFSNWAIGCIVAVAAGSWLYLHWPLWRIGGEVQRFLRQAPDQPVRALADLQPLQGLFRSLPLLARAWDLYYRTASGHDWGQGVPSPVPFFTADRLIEGPGRRRMAEALPGFLTALGILGTFLGLSVGLMDLSLEDLGTPTGLRQTVAPLLGGMQLAFHTSVVGIFASVLWAATDRWILGQTLSQLQRLHDRLDMLFPPVLETELLHELVRTQQQQIADLKSFMTDTLGPRIAQGVREAVEESLVPQFQQTLGALERVGRQVGDQQLAGVREMVDQFIAGMNTALDNQLQELARVLRETVDWQRSVKAELSDVMIHLRQTAETLQESLEASAGLLAEITRNSAAFALEAERARQALQSLGEVLAQLGAVQEQIAAAWTAANQAAERLDALRDQMTEAGAAQLQEMRQLWALAQEQLQAQSAELRAAAGDLRVLAVELRAASGEVRQRLGEDLEAFADRMHQGLGHTFDDFDRHLASASRHLAAVVAEVRESLADLPQVVQNLEEEMAGATRQFAEAAAAMRGPVTELPGVIESLYQQLQAATQGVEQRSREQMAAALGERPRQNPEAAPDNGAGVEAGEAEGV